MGGGTYAEAPAYFICNVRIPTQKPGERPGYDFVDVLLAEQKIKSVTPTKGVVRTYGDAVVIDGTDKMLLPGFVNAHTHSIEQWGRAIIKQLPLELWVDQLFKHGDPRVDPNCPAHMVYLSCLHMGLETLMTGGTAIMDHLFVRDIKDVEAAVEGYKKCGIRAFIAPMLGDMARNNYFPIVPNAEERNEEAHREHRCCGGLGPNGDFRETLGPQDTRMTQQILDLWEEAAQRFHDPVNGINIAIGPVQNWSASDELYERSVAIRKKYNLCGHTHMLESRAQALHSRQKYPGKGVMKRMKELGWLSLRGTSLAHCVWLDEEDQKIAAETGCVIVHNPVSNTRLGSGIAPIAHYRQNGVTVAIGCDGSCSNDGQDMHEAVKFSCLLNPLTTPEYKMWVSPRDVANMACQGGAKALGMEESLGKVEVGYEADLVLYDLTALSLLPRTDPMNLLILGRPSNNCGGNALASAWVRGKLVIDNGAPVGIDMDELRKALITAQPHYRDPEDTDPNGAPAEIEYRAAMGLNGSVSNSKDKDMLVGYPKWRVNYTADLA